mgnify:CR=1 FL=1
MTALIADPKEAKTFLDAHPHIQYFEVLFTSMSGVPRGKNLRRHDLLAIYEHGRYLPGTMLALSISGENSGAWISAAGSASG